ncbi:hypothetical protein WGM54_18290 [Paenibacillus polymyxa]
MKESRNEEIAGRQLLKEALAEQLIEQVYGGRFAAKQFCLCGERSIYELS